MVETVYSDWANFDGLNMPRRQESRYQGDAVTHFMTIESVTVNPPIGDERFAKPVSASAGVATKPARAS